VIQRVEFLYDEELKKIVTRSASILDIPIQDDGAMEIARISRAHQGG
jgi:Holliday junction DNA helicase RuvB